MFSMSALSSTTSKTKASTTRAEKKQETTLLKKARSECEEYGFYLPQARAALATANLILEKKTSTEDTKALYQIIKYMQNNYPYSLSKVYQSFCDNKEVAVINSCYEQFAQGQKSVFAKIKYFKNTPKTLDVEAMLTMLPQSQLISLNLDDNYIGDAGAEALAAILPNMSQLTSLGLGANSISDAGAQALAAALPNMPQLTSLDIGSNAISDAGAQALAVALPTMSQLTSLNLRYNSIGAAGAQALAKVLPNMPQLTNLDLSGNPIGAAGAQALAVALPNMSQLTSLDLRYNYIGAAGAQALAVALPKMPQLTSLNLWNNSIGAAGAQALAVALPNMSQLTSLNLWNNSIGSAGAQSLAVALPKMSQLTSLNLTDNSIGAAGAQALAVALPKMPQLTSLDLWNNSIGDAGAQALAVALPKMPQLTSLNLWNNSIGAAGAQALAVALPNMSQLTSLNLGYNSIGAAGAQALAVALPKIPQLTSLNLRSNSIDAAGAQALAAALPNMPQLTSLDLKYNSIGAAGAQALAKVLPNMPQLTSLDLELNYIGDAGAQDLAVALPKMPQLTSLNLESNFLHEAGAKILAVALPNMPQLTSLNLGCNSIGAAGAQALAVVLPSMQLTNLDLSINGIGDAGAQALAAVLPSMQLTSLHLGSNSIGDAGAQALAAKLSNMPQLTSLNLERNSIGAAGAQALAAVLPKMPQLTSLDLGANSIGDAGANCLIAAVAAIRLRGRVINVTHVDSISEEKVSAAMEKLRPEYEQETKLHQETKEQSKKERAANELPQRVLQPSTQEQKIAIKIAPTITKLVAAVNDQKTEAKQNEQKPILERLQALQTEQKATQLNAKELAAKQSELKELMEQIPKVQDKDLQPLKNHAQELQQVIAKQLEVQTKEAELKTIQSDPVLNDYYKTFLISLTDSIVACKAIHAQVGPAQADNVQAEKVDYAITGVQALGSHFPGISLLTAALTYPAQFAQKRTKLQKINETLQFLPTTTAGDLFADRLAMRLTLLQSQELKESTSKKTGFLDWVKDKVSNLANWATGGDNSNPVRRLANDHCGTFLVNVAHGQFKTPADPNDIPNIIVAILGNRATDSLSVSATVNSSSREQSAAMLITAPQPTLSNSSSSVTSTLPPVKDNQELLVTLIAEHKVLKEELAKTTERLKKAEKKINNSTETLESSDVSVGKESQQAYVAATANTNPKKTLVSVDELQKRVTQLEFWQQDANPIMAQLYDDLTTVNNQTQTGEKENITADIVYKTLQQDLAAKLEKYQKNPSINPQRLTSIRSIYASQQSFDEQKVSGIARLHGFLGCLCYERQSTQAAQQMDVAKTNWLLRPFRKTTSELAGIYDEFISSIFKHCQIKITSDTERLTEVNNWAQKYQQQCMPKAIASRL